jgi:hypothetical protein
VPPGVDTSVPNSARVWNYWLGGKDNYVADRQVGDHVLAALPVMGVIAREDRAFLGRAVRYVTERGIRQFLDIGTGIPTANNTREVAQAAVPEARIVYADNDKVVLAHARAADQHPPGSNRLHRRRPARSGRHPGRGGADPGLRSAGRGHAAGDPGAYRRGR